MGFIIHFYIIFGTNLLTQRPSPDCWFCLFQGFAEKEYQTESKWNKTFGKVIFGTISSRDLSTKAEEIQGAHEGGGRAPSPGRAPCLMGPMLLHRRTPSSYIYPCTLKTS